MVKNKDFTMAFKNKTGWGARVHLAHTTGRLLISLISISHSMSNRIVHYPSSMFNVLLNERSEPDMNPEPQVRQPSHKCDLSDCFFTINWFCHHHSSLELGKKLF